MSAFSTSTTDVLDGLIPIFTTMRGFSTDIGGGAGFGKRHNQDSGGTITIEFAGKTVDAYITGDGHGKEHGKTISEMAVHTAIQYLYDHPSDVVYDPISCIASLFAHVQSVVSPLFEAGGTTFTVILFNKTDGTLTTANVGDSGAILVSPTDNLSDAMRTSYFDVPSAESTNSPEGTPLKKILHLTKDHNPENPTERALLQETVMIQVREKLQGLISPHYQIRAETQALLLPEHRVRVKSLNDKQVAELIGTDSFCCNVVFDTQGHQPNIPIFNEDGTPSVPQGPSGLPGMYYKNVKSDWASLATSPFNKLAMTRSLVDKYCVSSLPTIQQFSLSSLPSGSTVCIVSATDGVWDNWLDASVSEFVLHESCMAALSTEGGAQRVADSFIVSNDVYAKENFEESRDNATAFVIYIKKA
jgi:serine/threonine protein phosphatase PrpC